MNIGLESLFESSRFTQVLLCADKFCTILLLNMDFSCPCVSNLSFKQLFDYEQILHMKGPNILKKIMSVHVGTSIFSLAFTVFRLFRFYILQKSNPLFDSYQCKKSNS